MWGERQYGSKWEISQHPRITAAALLLLSLLLLPAACPEIFTNPPSKPSAPTTTVSTILPKTPR